MKKSLKTETRSVKNNKTLEKKTTESLQIKQAPIKKDCF